MKNENGVQGLGQPPESCQDAPCACPQPDALALHQLPPQQLPSGQQGRQSYALVGENEGRDEDTALRLSRHSQPMQSQVRPLLLVDKQRPPTAGN